MKPTSFLSGWAGDAGGLLKNLEGGLKPEAFFSSWTSKRPTFMNALNMLK